MAAATAPRVRHRRAAPSPNGGDDPAVSDLETRSPSRRRQSMRDTRLGSQSIDTPITIRRSPGGETSGINQEIEVAERAYERLLADILRLGRVVHHGCRENRSLEM